MRAARLACSEREQAGEVVADLGALRGVGRALGADRHRRRRRRGRARRAAGRAARRGSPGAAREARLGSRPSGPSPRGEHGARVALGVARGADGGGDLHAEVGRGEREGRCATCSAERSRRARCSASAKGSSAVGADGLEDAVAVEEAAVVDGDLGLLGREELPSMEARRVTPRLRRSRRGSRFESERCPRVLEARVDRLRQRLGRGLARARGARRAPPPRA